MIPCASLRIGEDTSTNKFPAKKAKKHKKKAKKLKPKASAMEDSALGTLYASLRGSSSSSGSSVWMAPQRGESWPPEWMVLLEESARVAERVLPKYDCGQLRHRVTDPASGRQLQGMAVKRAALPRLIRAVLFSERRRVDVYTR